MTINCKGQLIDLSLPKVMGIINLTPDSFYSGSRFHNVSDILKQVEHMLLDGATFIDIGAYSSRPNAHEVTEDEELNRLIPIIKHIIKTFPEALISVDTFRSPIAKAAIDSGACMVNDISAGFLDSEMLKTIAELQVPYIMMHMRGTPKTMQSQTHYDNLLKEIVYYFSERLEKARELGIIDIITDPGFGFSKTTAQNFELLNHLEHFKHLEVPYLVGISRKSMIYKSLETDAEHALNGTTVLNTIALQKGAGILRVHDVKEAMECITLLNQLNS